MKDYYDVYLIYKFKWEYINQNSFIKAMENTFNKRKFNGNILELFEIVKNSEILKERWKNYSKKYNYANNISYEEIIECLEKIIEVSEPIIGCME